MVIIIMKNQAVCFTGHRNIPADRLDALSRDLRKKIVAMIESGKNIFLAGGALGFDTLAAQTVLALKSDYPQIQLRLVLPCLAQTRGWSATDVRIYEDIKSKADTFCYTSQEYTRGCMQKRNRALVDGSCACICYLTESKGGTAYTVKYAKKKGLRIVNLGEEMGQAENEQLTLSESIAKQ